MTVSYFDKSEYRSNIDREIQIFNKFFKELLIKAEKKEKNGIISFIYSRLYQFKLNQNYDHIDVLLEARDIAIRKIYEGEIIKDFHPWFKKICFFKIRELYRLNVKDKKILNKLHIVDDCYDEDKNYLDFGTLQNIEALVQAWSKLSKTEQEILILKEIKNFSWNEVIQKLIHSKDYDEKNIDFRVNLRQQKRRALIKLRKYFFTYLKNDSK